MLSHRKEQGFIIRKGRKMEQDKEDRKKYMSQTDFYKKAQSPMGYRSPGSILHVKFKEDIGMIRSSKSRWAQYNPENSRFPDIKFNYEQTNNNLKQRGDNANLNDNSFEEIVQSRLQTTPGIDIDANISLFKILQETHYQLHHRQSSCQIFKCVKQYLEFINTYQLGSVNSLNIPLVRKKIIKQSLINERISFLLIGFVEVNNLYDIFKSFINNLATYSVDNLLLRLAILTQGKQKQIVQILKNQGKQSFLNKGFQTIKTNNQIMSDSITKISKADDLFYENLRKITKANKTLHVKGQFTAILQYFSFFMHLSNKANLAPFLSVSPAPYLPAQDFDKYTLVIDVLQCLCNHNKKNGHSFRPFAEYFLDQMSQYYDIVSFSDAMPNQVNKVISLLDRKKHIKHRLYKHHLDKTKSFNGKDLTRLGRDLNTVVLIDTSLHANPNNTIVMNHWRGKKNDAQLAELCPILAMLAFKKLTPQKVIKKLHQKNEQNHKLGLKYQNIGLDLQ